MPPQIIFLFAGFTSIVIQTLFIREMLAVFQGNELSIGIILSQWLLGTGIGNLAASRYPGREKPVLAVSYILCGIFLAAAFFLTRDLRTLIHTFPGEGISLKATFFSSLLLLAPLGAFTGAQFTLAFAHIKKDISAGSGYLFESLGYFAGGLIFTYLLIPYLTSSAVVMLTGALCFAAAAFVFPGKRPKTILALLAAAILFLMPWASRYLERLTLAKLYPGFNVERSINSPYGQIVSAERNGETYLFSNGTPIITLPNPDTERSEKLGLLPLLFKRAPENVLILGGAARLIQPVLNRGAVSLDYAESDPVLLQTLKDYWPAIFADPRLKVYYSDGRKFLRRSGTAYDAILIGMPYPLTLPLNRYYTVEFFRLARKKLSKDGIIALSLPGSLVYVSSAMAELNTVIKKTAEKVFPYSIIIPGDENILIASSAPLVGKETLKYRLSRLRARTVFLSQKFIDYSLDLQKADWLRAEMDKHRRWAPLNRDFYPAAMTAALIWWQSLFAPNTASVYAFFVRFYWLIFLIPVLWFLSKRSGAGSTSFSSGFCAMGLQMLSIWGLQVACGNIYQLIGMLNAAFMAGTALGAYAYNYKSGFLNFKIKGTALIFYTELAFAVWISLWLVILAFSPGSALPFFLLSAVTGLLLGFQFPALTALGTGNTGSLAGSIYSYDLLGGWLAALLVGTVLIPAGGFIAAMIFLWLIKTGNSYWWSRHK